MDRKLALLFLFLLFFSVSYSQDTMSIRIGPSYVSSEESKYFFICDGIPIFKSKQILKLVDTIMIDSIVIHKVKTYDYKNKQIYNAFIEIRTVDSLNLGLKRILKQTDNWIFNNPLGDLYINDKKTNWIKGFEQLSMTHPDLIEEIDIIEAKSDSIKCRYGMIRVIIKNE